MLNDYQKLTATARRLRQHIIKMVGAAGSGHPGGSLSAVEIMTALYFKVMR
ncbi:MAG: transketolase, partial [Moorella sp. (in: Bacteria)]|nr:transketolase [Moorella sp. (in: firmicutes)]